MNGKVKIIIAMLIYGSIGVFVRNIDLSAIQIAFLRATTGSAFLAIVSMILNRSSKLRVEKNSLKIYLLSGALLGLNWYFLFKAFEYTSISSAILVYYLTPTIVILLSPFVLNESLNLHKLLCMGAGIIGLSMIVVSDMNASLQGQDNLKGIGFALLAAVFYASVILINKKYPGADGLGTTVVQLIASGLVLIPVLVASGGFESIALKGTSLWLILILGLVHTGIAYLLYFSSMKVLDGQTVAIYCYIDPISAMVFAWIFLGEPVSYPQAIGGVFILGATYYIDYEKNSDLKFEEV
ncbi:DMT family transporter [Fusibacter sp. JL216-2]|uniref:DMT family transporter n=1 Tax=Fusibacter sp. JL216-2 TaxID=3071453 RepID=UPI003D327DEC